MSCKIKTREKNCTVSKIKTIKIRSPYKNVFRVNNWYRDSLNL